jgi:amylosucrase
MSPFPTFPSKGPSAPPLDRLELAFRERLGRAAATAEPLLTRVRQHLPALRHELAALYGERADFDEVVLDVLEAAHASWRERPAELQALDTQREREPGWFQSERMLGGVCYVDLFAGDLNGIEASIPYFQELGLNYLHLMPPYDCPQPHNDGGYAVSSYRRVNPALGTMDDLRRVAGKLREAGISLVLDFVFNHTSDEHDWAIAAERGEPAYRDFYFIFEGRTEPDRYERTLREIFPDEHTGSFSPLDRDRWVWTTFHRYQWDLNYGNPQVFRAMAQEMLFIANLGVQFIRMDAVAFVWKRLGTSCENLPEAHSLIRAYNALARIAAPALLFKSEAIVHPDDVVRYISPQECQVSYNPLQMALLWSSLATRDVNLLQQALEARHALPAGTAWVNYGRSHDDNGWTFDHADAAALGVEALAHRQFLNRFYVNRFEGSFARGVPFQDNPATGDCRISGTCASLCGIEQGDPLAVARILLLHGVTLATGGIPLIYLGDELAAPNDVDYLQDEGKAGDSRWVHRPARQAARHAQRHAPDTDAGRVFAGLRHLIALRRATSEFAGGRLIGFRSKIPSVLGFTRPGARGSILVLANFSEHPCAVSAEVLSAMPASAIDLVAGARHELHAGLTLAPCQMVWLDCRSD